MQVHVDRGGERYGPYSLEDVNAYLANGTLLPTDQAWQDGMTDWVPIEQIPGVTMPGGAPPPSPPPVASAADSKLAGEKAKIPEAGDSDEIQVTRNGEAIGPYSRNQAKEHLLAGQLLPTDWGWYDGMDEWKPLNEVLGLPALAQSVEVIPGKAKTSNQKRKESGFEFSFDYIGLATSVALLVVCAFYVSSVLSESTERWQALFEGGGLSSDEYKLAEQAHHKFVQKKA